MIDESVGKYDEIAFSATDLARPAELYYMSSPTASPRRLTNLNAEVADLALGRSEVISWQLDEYTHNGIVTYPPDFSSNQKYPLVLVIHGGPTPASLEAFSSSAQLMACKSWGVFRPTY